jgi:hypothetical protein
MTWTYGGFMQRLTLHLSISIFMFAVGVAAVWFNRQPVPVCACFQCVSGQCRLLSLYDHPA